MTKELSTLTYFFDIPGDIDVPEPPDLTGTATEEFLEAAASAVDAHITQEGEIKVNHITLVVDTDDVKVWFIDLGSKYAGICGYSNESLHLMAEDDTRGVVEEKRGESTVIGFTLPADGPDFRWQTIVDCARYTARFVAYRWRSDLIQLPEQPAVVSQVSPVLTDLLRDKDNRDRLRAQRREKA